MLDRKVINSICCPNIAGSELNLGHRGYYLVEFILCYFWLTEAEWKEEAGVSAYHCSMEDILLCQCPGSL